MKSTFLVALTLFSINVMADPRFDHADAQRTLALVQSKAASSKDCFIRVAFNNDSATVELQSRVNGETLMMQFPLNATMNFNSSTSQGGVMVNHQPYSFRDGGIFTNWDGKLWVSMLTPVNRVRVETDLYVRGSASNVTGIFINQKILDRCFPGTPCYENKTQVHSVGCSF